MPFPETLPSDEQLQEIFALLCSPTAYEEQQIYDQTSPHFFMRENLEEEYKLSQEKREFAIDAWRAVTAFLHRRKVTLLHKGTEIELGKLTGFTD